MHKRLHQQAERRKQVQQDKVAAAAEAGVDFGQPPADAAAAAAAAVDEAAAQQQEQLKVMEKVRLHSCSADASKRDLASHLPLLLLVQGIQRCRNYVAIKEQLTRAVVGLLL